MRSTTLALCCRVLLCLASLASAGHGAMAQCDPAGSEPSVQEAKDTLTQIKIVMAILKQAGLLAPPLRAAYKGLAEGVSMGLDAGDSAIKVEKELNEIFAKKESLCAIAYPYDPHTDHSSLNANMYERCTLNIERNKSWDATKKTLDWNDPNSVVRRTLTKWKCRLFEQSARSAATRVFDVKPFLLGD